MTGTSDSCIQTVPDTQRLSNGTQTGLLHIYREEWLPQFYFRFDPSAGVKQPETDFGWEESVKSDLLDTFSAGKKCNMSKLGTTIINPY